MRKLMNRLMMSCKKASSLIVKRDNFSLTRKGKIRLFFHLLMCDACSSFSKQNKFLHRVMEDQDKSPEETLPNNEVPDNLKENIISKLK